jgi:hypothetical protein
VFNMAQVIVIKYVEYNHWEQETWTHCKLIPYTNDNIVRVEHYVNNMKNYILRVRKPSTFVISHFTKNIADVGVEGVIRKLANRYDGNALYKDSFTFEVLTSDQSLPYETELNSHPLTCSFQIYKYFPC